MKWLGKGTEGENISSDALFGSDDKLISDGFEKENKLNDNVRPLPVWDKKDALIRLGGKESRLRMLVELFLTESTTYFERLKEAVQTKNITDIRSSAHSIKGIVGNLSAKQVFETSEILEKAAIDNDIEKVEGMWELFVEQYTLLSAELEKDMVTGSLDKKREAKDDSDKFPEQLRSIAKSLARGDYLAPGEVKVLMSSIKTDEANTAFQRLMKQVSDFDNDDALITLKEIASIHKIEL